MCIMDHKRVYIGSHLFGFYSLWEGRHSWYLICLFEINIYDNLNHQLCLVLFIHICTCIYIILYILTVLTGSRIFGIPKIISFAEKVAQYIHNYAKFVLEKSKWCCYVYILRKHVSNFLLSRCKKYIIQILLFHTSKENVLWTNF